MILSSMTFGTAYPLYLATAAVTYFLLKHWGRGTESSSSWIGLGLALGLGALAKTSFALIAGPILAISFYLGWRKLIAHPSPKSITKAAILGTLIALPWWLLNVRPALWYARYSSDFVRHSLGGTLITGWLLWVGNFVQGALGPLTAILLGFLVVVLVLYRVSKRETGINAAQKTAMWVCFLSPLPLVLAQLVGRNDNLGHFSPAMIPWSVGIGIIVGATPWTRVRLLSAGASVLFGIQLLMIVVPAFRPIVYPTTNALFNLPPGLVMARYDQWDWEGLRAINNSYGIKNSSISFLGNGLKYNWAQITYPWAVHKEGMTGVNWLRRYEDGAIDWAKIMNTIGKSDIVLTAPNYIGVPSDKEDLDNQYNREFARRLSVDPRFDGPIHLTLGRFEPVDIEVFINKSDITQH
jgi:4-amino-4-deoxy-L-arabinose transferase-like glycosyltransferase